MRDDAVDDHSWTTVLSALLSSADLSEAQAGWAMEEMMSGNAADAQIGAFLLGLAAKGVTVTELSALVQVMQARARPVEVVGPILDIVGTGGDRLGTVNISTMSSLVAAGAGVRVVKHGNRGASSTAGAADVIEALGVDLDMDADRARRCAHEVGLTFLFAQKYHPSMRSVAPARKQLGVPTVFNFLGPLSNPARVDAQALGCSSADMAFWPGCWRSEACAARCSVATTAATRSRPPGSPPCGRSAMRSESIGWTRANTGST